jgi:hypothetical protein
VCRCTARNFGQISEKLTDLERFKQRFPAIFRNFTARIAHISEGLSSEQYLRVAVIMKSIRRRARACLAMTSRDTYRPTRTRSRDAMRRMLTQA